MDNFTVLILASCIPAILVFGASYFVLSTMLKADGRKRDTEVLLASKRTTIPMRLQAYERLILFLERIAIDSMLLRVKDNMQTNADLHLLLLQSIRTEYEHNLSQQLYVSAEVWDTIKEAKEAVATLINDSTKGTNPHEPSIGLTKMLLDKLVDGEQPTEFAIKKLKDEARKLL